MILKTVLFLFFVYFILIFLYSIITKILKVIVKLQTQDEQNGSLIIKNLGNLKA